MTTKTRSRFDELHDRFDSFRTTKRGTRYERLAAVVLKALDEQNTVIHDLRLIGESEVGHQIDVTVECGGSPRRLLVECKDFDVSGDSVGLDIVRNFYAVVEDTKVDEAIIITCNDFTTDARAYARAKGIRLAHLRIPDPDDWRIGSRAIETTMLMVIPELVMSRLVFVGSADSILPKLTADRAAVGVDPEKTKSSDLVFINHPQRGRVQYNDYVSELMNSHVKEMGDADESEFTVNLEGSTYEIGERGGIPLHSLIMKVRLRESDHKEVIRITADTIAALILEFLGEPESVLWEHDLRRFEVGEDGAVRERPL